MFSSGKNKNQKLNLQLGKTWRFLSCCFPHSNDGNPVIHAHNYTKVSRKCWDPLGKLSEWVWLRNFSNKQIFCISSSYTGRLHAVLHALSENEQFLLALALLISRLFQIHFSSYPFISMAALINNTFKIIFTTCLTGPMANLL